MPDQEITPYRKDVSKPFAAEVRYASMRQAVVADSGYARRGRSAADDRRQPLKLADSLIEVAPTVRRRIPDEEAGDDAYADHVAH